MNTVRFPAPENRRYTKGDRRQVKRLLAAGLSESEVARITGFPEGSISYLRS